MKVLIVEDDHSTANVLKMALDGMVDIETAGNYESATLCMARGRPDILLLDYYLNDGYTATDLMNEAQHMWPIPPKTLLMSAGRIPEVLPYKPDGIMNKPFDLETFYAKLGVCELPSSTDAARSPTR